MSFFCQSANNFRMCFVFGPWAIGVVSRWSLELLTLAVMSRLRERSQSQREGDDGLLTFFPTQRFMLGMLMPKDY